MGVSIRIKGNRVYLDIIQNRKHRWESLHMVLSTDSITRKEQLKTAEMCRAKRELQLVCGEWDFNNPVAGKRKLMDYLLELQKDTHGTRRQTFSNFIAYLKKFPLGDVKLSVITSRWVQDFQTWMENNTDLKRSTIRLYLSCLRQALNRATKNRIIAHNPAADVKNLTLEENNFPTLTVEELRRMVKIPVGGGIPQECKKAFLFSCYTGLRVSDLSTLQWKDIETKSERCGAVHWLKKRQKKTKRFIEEPLNPAAWELIRCRDFLPMPEAFVFPLLAGITTAAGNWHLKAWAKAAGIEKNISWHTARRTFATLGLENGVDPFTIQRLMGHTSINMTAKYAKSDGIKLAAVGTFENILDDEAEKEQKKA